MRGHGVRERRERADLLLRERKKLGRGLLFGLGRKVAPRPSYTFFCSVLFFFCILFSFTIFQKTPNQFKPNPKVF
jgi:hypothetical protein